MQKFLLSTLFILSISLANAQNVGVGTSTPSEKLDVNGKIKANGMLLPGGSQFDFLMKSNATGEVGYKKGNGGVGINFIICLQGEYPSPNTNPTLPFIGEIKIFAGNFAPKGWAFCQGQILPISQNTALFSVLGTYYGGDGQVTFALPDLRGATVIGTGAAPAGYQWSIGQKSN